MSRKTKYCASLAGSIDFCVNAFHSGLNWMQKIERIGFGLNTTLRKVFNDISKTTKISYLIVAILFVLLDWLHLATPLLTILFSYFALSKLNRWKSKWTAVVLFIILGTLVIVAFGYFFKQACVALPNIAKESIPVAIDYAKNHDLDLPFTDWDSLKALFLDGLTNQTKYMSNFANFAHIVLREMAFCLIGLVASVSVFLHTKFHLDQQQPKDNLYMLVCEKLADRFSCFYESFDTVMGAQLTISTINTCLTACFLLVIGLPYATVVIGATFLCGLLPIIGNLISNTIIVGIALTVSMKMAVYSLVFLIVLHKLEYFLNSKIIGGRIKNPVWMTLLGMIVGERLIGIPGVILAPVVLYYFKQEMAAIKIPALLDEEKQQPLNSK
jgi:predicted PurR-regulated permease PerM